MEQNAKDKNQNSGFFKQNMPPILVAAAVIVIGAIIFFSTRDNPAQNNNSGNNNPPPTEQNNGSPTEDNANNAPSDDADGSLVSDSTDGSTANSVGNVNASGTLQASDDAAKGNLVVDSGAGKIYIKTARDFSGLIGKHVTLQAEGTINKFVFLGFAEATVDAGDVGGGEPASSANVTFSGMLNKSDSAKGNYTIVSGSTTVYLQTAHDYSSLVGSEVTLKAEGTINSFTGATITKK